MSAANDRVISKRAELEQEIDHLIAMAKAGGDVTAERALVLSSADLLVVLAGVERDATADAIVEQYRTLAIKARGGHA